jgi:hypothetical protein
MSTPQVPVPSSGSFSIQDSTCRELVTFLEITITTTRIIMIRRSSRRKLLNGVS